MLRSKFHIAHLPVYLHRRLFAPINTWCIDIYFTNLLYKSYCTYRLQHHLRKWRHLWKNQQTSQQFGSPFQSTISATTTTCKHSLTYSLTPWCRVVLEKLTGLQLVKKFPAFHGTRRFITAPTSIRHLSLSWASPIQSIYPHPTYWRSILILSTHLRLSLSSDLFPSGFPTKTLYTPPLLTHTRHMPSPSNSSRFYHPHNIGWAVQTVNKKMLAFRLTRHLRWHRWMSTLPRRSNTLYCSVLCIIIALAYILYSFWLIIKIHTSVPLEAWSGPEGSRKLRFPDYVTMAQDGGKVVSLTHRPLLPPGNTPGTYFC